MEHSLRIQALFKKYLQRTCTRQELEELVALLQHSDAEDELDEQMQALWQQLKEDGTQHKVHWPKIYNAIITSADTQSTDIAIQKNRFRKWWYVAASVVIFAFFSIGYFIFQNQEKNSKKENTNPFANEIKKPPSGPRQTIHLPDGSTVILNKNSRLNYPPAFASNTREVNLTGEGYFDIKHNPKQPFLVHTGKITVKVVGTAFDIKAYPADDEVKVTVTRGKVQVLKENKSLGMITASQQISFNNVTQEYFQKTIDIAPVVEWKPAELFFNDITMDEAAQQVAKRFNIVVIFSNPAIKECRVTATFSENNTAEEMIAVICAVSKADYKVNNNKILIDGKGCN